MSNQSTELAIIEQLNTNGMEKTAAEALLSSYGVPFVEAGQLIEKGRQIVVADESDSENMALARTTRLELRKQRIAIEKKHDELKADSLAYGKAVDLVQRVALEQIKPVEEHLLLQEKYAETKQEERRQARIAERTAELAQYVDDVSVYNYGDMGDEAFKLLIDQVKDAKEKREAEEKAEADRLEKERIEREEADRIAREKAEKELEEEKARNAKKLARVSQLSSLGFSFQGSNGFVYDDLTVTEEELNNSDDKAWDAYIDTATKTITLRKEAAEKAAAEEAERVKKIEEQAAADRKAAEEAAREKAAAEAAAAEQARLDREAAEKAAGAPDKEKILTCISSIESLVIIGVTSEKGKKIAERIEKHHASAVEAYKKLVNEEL